MWTPCLFDHLDPEEARIYNDLTRRISSVSKSWKAKRLNNATAGREQTQSKNNTKNR